eukprot:PhM_4_TR5725/c0_g1_i1/m.90479
MPPKDRRMSRPQHNPFEEAVERITAEIKATEDEVANSKANQLAIAAREEEIQHVHAAVVDLEAKVKAINLSARRSLGAPVRRKQQQQQHSTAQHLLAPLIPKRISVTPSPDATATAGFPPTPNNISTPQAQSLRARSQSILSASRRSAENSAADVGAAERSSAGGSPRPGSALTAPPDLLELVNAVRDRLQPILYARYKLPLTDIERSDGIKPPVLAPGGGGASIEGVSEPNRMPLSPAANKANPKKGKAVQPVEAEKIDTALKCPHGVDPKHFFTLMEMRHQRLQTEAEMGKLRDKAQSLATENQRTVVLTPSELRATHRKLNALRRSLEEAKAQYEAAKVQKAAATPAANHHHPTTGKGKNKS